jgi:FkbM family methyltransferase
MTNEAKVLTIGSTTISYSHPHDMMGIAEVFVLDVYMLRSIDVRGSLIIDIGAGIGDFTIAAATQSKGTGLVLALEPNPQDYEIMSTNVELNQLAGVIPQNCTLGEPGSSPLVLTFKGTTFTAPCITLQEMLYKAGLTLEDASSRNIILKIDVEGAEKDYLTLLKPLLPHVSAVLIELHGTKKEIDSILAPQGFVFTRISPPQYIRNALKFAIRHPLAAVEIYRRLRAYDRKYVRLGKIVRGIDISSSSELVVGMYSRTDSKIRVSIQDTSRVDK